MRGRPELHDGRLRTMVSRHDAVLDDGRAVPAPPPHPENAPVDRGARARADRTRRGALRDRSRSPWCLGAVTDPEYSAARARIVAVLGAPRAGGPPPGACLDAVTAQREVGTLAVPHPVQYSSPRAPPAAAIALAWRRPEIGRPLLNRLLISPSHRSHVGPVFRIRIRNSFAKEETL